MTRYVDPERKDKMQKVRKIINEMGGINNISRSKLAKICDRPRSTIINALNKLKNDKGNMYTKRLDYLLEGLLKLKEEMQ